MQEVHFPFAGIADGYVCVCAFCIYFSWCACWMEMMPQGEQAGRWMILYDAGRAAPIYLFTQLQSANKDLLKRLRSCM
jgi:hypothetical protein